MEKSLAQPMSERDAEQEQGCTGRTDKMMGMVKKIDAQGFGILMARTVPRFPSFRPAL